MMIFITLNLQLFLNTGPRGFWPSGYIRFLIFRLMSPYNMISQSRCPEFVPEVSSVLSLTSPSR